jgi:hypothetical protein
MKTVKKLFSIILLAALPIILNGQVLVVTEVTQEENQWCWAGASQCVFKYYCDTDIQQCEIAEYARLNCDWTVNGQNPFGNTPCCQDSDSCNYWNYLYGAGGAIDDILENASEQVSLTVQSLDRSLSRTEVQTMLGDNRIGIIRIDNGGHFIVLHGYDSSSDQLYLMDPWYGEGFNVVDFSTEIYSNRTWTHSQPVLTDWTACDDPCSCSIPTNLGTQDLAATSVTLTWEDSNASYSSFNIRYRESGTTSWTQATSTTTSKAINGLTSSTDYEFQVETVCSSTCSSGYSDSAAFTTQDETCDCNVPTNLGTQDLAATSVTLTWEDSNASYSSFNIRYRESGTTTWSQTTSTTTSKAISGLASSTTYEFQVETVCSSSCSSGYSDSATFTTLEGACGIPSNLTAGNITSTSATLSWSAVSNATSYNVRYRIVGASTWTTTSSTTNSVGISSLTPGTQYEFQVESVCSSGNSGYSDSATFNTGGGDWITAESEPNGSAASADGPMGSGVSVTGSAANQDNDWFYFNTTSSGTININLANNGYSVIWYLYHESNTNPYAPLASGFGTGSYNAPAAGKYYIRVFNMAYWGSPVSYTLTVNFQ